VGIRVSTKIEANPAGIAQSYYIKLFPWNGSVYVDVTKYRSLDTFEWTNSKVNWQTTGSTDRASSNQFGAAVMVASKLAEWLDDNAKQPSYISEKTIEDVVEVIASSIQEPWRAKIALERNELPECKSDIFDCGRTMAIVAPRMAAYDVEGVVKAFRDLTKLKVDWHYAAGRVVVKWLEE